MTENFDHKIYGLKLENFTCFGKTQFGFSSGINVFIGENGTGKTHVLKAMYALLRKDWRGIADKESKKLRVGANFMEIFNLFEAKSLSSLIYGNQSEGKIQIFFSPDEAQESHFIGFEINKHHPHRYQSSKGLDEILLENKELLFIPTLEMLSYTKGFIYTYERGQNAFDGTYLDLVKSLDGPPLNGNAKTETHLLLDGIEKSINAKVYRRDDKFYLKFNNLPNEIEAHLTAEGLKKLAQMIYLVQNGTLNKDTILFWDEPEVNLNPRYIKIVAQFLQTLAKHGVQIFVATHDYLLSYQLSLFAEYPEKDTPPIRFFGLSKGENGTEVETANTMNGIKNNAILEEYAAQHDFSISRAIDYLASNH